MRRNPEGSDRLSLAALIFSCAVGLFVAAARGFGYEITPEWLIFGGGAFCALTGAVAFGSRGLLGGFMGSGLFFLAGLGVGTWIIWFVNLHAR